MLPLWCNFHLFSPTEVGTDEIFLVTLILNVTVFMCSLFVFLFILLLLFFLSLSLSVNIEAVGLNSMARGLQSEESLITTSLFSPTLYYIKVVGGLMVTYPGRTTSVYIFMSKIV